MSKWFHKPPKKMNIQSGITSSKKDASIQNLDRYRKFLRVRKLLSIILGAVLLVVLVIVLATAFFTGKFTELFYQMKQMSAEDAYPVVIKEQSFTGAAALERYNAILTQNSLIFLDEKGQRADEAVIGYSSPILRSTDSGVMVYDHAGTQFTFAQPFHTGYTVKTDQKIITGTISPDGNCAIATYHDRYAAEVSVYHTDGSLSYRWNSASDKVISMAFDGGGKRLYVCCINADGGFIQTIVYALNINSEKEVYRTVLSSAVTPLYLHPMANGKLAIVTTGDIEFLDNNGNSTSALYYYSDLLAVCGEEKYIAMAQQNIYNNDTDIIVYNADGDRIGSLEIGDVPMQMEISGTDIYCLTENELLHWNFAREEQTVYHPEENYSGMIVNDNTVYLYSNNTISRIHFEEPEGADKESAESSEVPESKPAKKESDSVPDESSDKTSSETESSDSESSEN